MYVYIYTHRNCIYTSAPDIPGCFIFPLRRRPGAVASESKEAVKALETKFGEAAAGFAGGLFSWEELWSMSQNHRG